MSPPTPDSSNHRSRRRDRLRFLMERLLLRGIHYRLALAAIVMIAVAMLAGAS